MTRLGSIIVELFSVDLAWQNAITTGQYLSREYLFEEFWYLEGVDDQVPGLQFSFQDAEKHQQLWFGQALHIHVGL